MSSLSRSLQDFRLFPQTCALMEGRKDSHRDRPTPWSATHRTHKYFASATHQQLQCLVAIATPAARRNAWPWWDFLLICWIIFNFLQQCSSSANFFRNVFLTFPIRGNPSSQCKANSIILVSFLIKIPFKSHDSQFTTSLYFFCLSFPWYMISSPVICFPLGWRFVLSVTAELEESAAGTEKPTSLQMEGWENTCSYVLVNMEVWREICITPG